MTFLEVLGVNFLLQNRQLVQLGRIEHSHVVFVIGGVIDAVVLTVEAITPALLEAVDFLELVRFAELKEILEHGVCKCLFVTAVLTRLNDALVSDHFLAFVRILVLTVRKLFLALLEIAAFDNCFELFVLFQFRRFLNLTPAFDTLLHVINGFFKLLC